ncbi:MAG: hypothetical protein EA341_15515 [Mongoliibacter sp.]|uniref:hypothetical protein n=1 Tax=Mongoliibacter sp. TaxID=2022438 RepID=UPI0012F09751|nr:hypothetical protein [Mongoliibacter sp.]TVP45154.1 MAG: hypothetical protein EA341_15515 [Mongoliibacter sp.]
MKKILLGFTIAFAITACQREGEFPSNPDQNIVISTDTQALNTRVSLEGAGVISIFNPELAMGRTLEDTPAGRLPLMLVSQVEPPRYDGKILKATHVDIDGDYAFVSYNKEGPGFYGAIEIYNISNPLKPEITAQAMFKTADINSLTYQNGKLFIAAAFDIDRDFEGNTAAQYMTVDVSNGNFTSDFTRSDIDGFAATDVTRTPSHTAVASGSNGSIGLFNGSNEMESELAISDLRAVKYGNNILAALSGTEGIHLLNPQTLSNIGKISIPEDIPQSKRTLDMGPEMLFVSEGLRGAGIYSLPSGNLIEKIAIPINPEGVLSEDLVTNAVSYDENLLLMANGGAGVSIADLTNLSNIEKLGILSLSGSSNFVKIKGQHLFVATGAGGLQILKISKEEVEDDAGNTAIDCSFSGRYMGNQNLNINSNQAEAYRGSNSFKNVNIGGHLIFCGSMSVENSLNVNSNGLFEMNGSFAFGQYQRNNTLSINSNAVMRISGSAVIYGDINLNSGATLEFVGEGNTITIFGEVRKGSNITISGNFTDTEGKLN